MVKDVVSRASSARVPNQYGEFTLYVYSNTIDNKEHLAYVMGDLSVGGDVLTRIHSECLTGDVLGSTRCDCGDQLDRSLETIAGEGRGVLLYLRQEGRGIGLVEKLKAYTLQDEGHDTVDANVLLGHQADERDYTVAALMLSDLGVRSVRLLTNNPDKIRQLEEYGIVVSAREPLPPRWLTVDTARYLHTKVERMNHILDLDESFEVPHGRAVGR